MEQSLDYQRRVHNNVTNGGNNDETITDARYRGPELHRLKATQSQSQPSSPVGLNTHAFPPRGDSRTQSRERPQGFEQSPRERPQGFEQSPRDRQGSFEPKPPNHSPQLQHQSSWQDIREDSRNYTAGGMRQGQPMNPNEGADRSRERARDVSGEGRNASSPVMRRSDARSDFDNVRLPNGLPTRSSPSLQGYYNTQPRGLRVRTPQSRGPAPRGRTAPDPQEAMSGRRRTENGGVAPIIQMPLAFNSISSRSRNAPPSSSPDGQGSRPTGRRPSVMRDESNTSAPRIEQRSQRTPSRRNPNEQRQQQQQPPPNGYRRPTPSPPGSRSRGPTPPPGDLHGSPSEIRTNFRSALANARVHASSSSEQTDEQRSSVATSNSALTTTSTNESENGDFSVEDAIGMYESDEDDIDPSQNPLIDQQKRTPSGTPVGSRGYSSEIARKASPSRTNELTMEEEDEDEALNISPGDVHEMTTYASNLPVPTIVATVDDLTAELEEAQNTARPSIPTREPIRPEQIGVAITPGAVINNRLSTFSISNDTPPQNPTVDLSSKDPRDQYGFRKKTQYVTLEEYDAWYNGYEETLVRRQKKWQALLKESGLQPGDDGPVTFPPRSQKVKRFVRKGIPPEWRGAAWFWYAGGRTHLGKNPGLYDKLVAQGAIVGSEAPELIERDLHRTFPDNIHFKPEPLPTSMHKKHKSSGSKIFETPMIKSLRRVLLAFANYVPRIGYCQSLNFWAGMLLLFMDEEKSFWMLYIITHIYLPGTHDVSLEGSNIDQGVLMMSVRESIPQLWQKISTGLDGSPITLSNAKLPDITLCTAAWLMSGFISNLPVETVLRVWDTFFYEGSKILFRISLALFKHAEPQVRNLSDPMDVFQVIQTCPRRFIDAGALMDLCFKRRNGYGHLSQQQIDERRAERKAIIEKERVRRQAGEDDDGETLARGSRDDMSLRKGFAMDVGRGMDDAANRFKRQFSKKK